MKLLPEGISKFTEIIDNDLYFVDKTPYIAEFEKKKKFFLFFVRPRRFGKSIFLNMLETYYDIAQKDQFEHYFGKTDIYKNVTPEQGKYLVINLDFSKVSGNTDSVASVFDTFIGMDIDTYAEKYCSFFKEDFSDKISKLDSAASKLNYFCMQARLRKYPVYLMIDEYDNFTNVILTEEGESKYHDITHGTGFYRDFFKVVKSCCQKVFMTGTSPVTLDDLTSGYNIATHITLDPAFNSMLGFTTAEVREIIAYYQENGLLSGFDPEKIISDMAVWYDGYCFSEDAFSNGDHVFNSYMVTEYLSKFAQNRKPPKNMLVENTLIDYEKLKRLMEMDQLIKSNTRESIIDNLIAGTPCNRPVAVSFPAKFLNDVDFFPGYLFYLGMLTVRGVKGGAPLLDIPNQNVRMQYYGYLQRRVKDTLAEDVSSKLAEAFDEAGFSGNIKTLVDVIMDYYDRYSGNRQLKLREGLFQAFFLAFMSWNYMYDPAPELELNHGYNDIFLFPKIGSVGVEHSYLIELKYLKPEDSDAVKNKYIEDARKQLRDYAADPKSSSLSRGTSLHLTAVVLRGFKLEFFEDAIWNEKEASS